MKNLDFSGRGSGNKPLRTTAELAAEIGWSTRRLAAVLRLHAGAPKPKFEHHGAARKTWYDPAEVLAFVRALEWRTRKIAKT